MQYSAAGTTPDASARLQQDWWSGVWSDVWGPQLVAALIVVGFPAVAGWILRRAADGRPESNKRARAGLWIANHLRPAEVNVKWALAIYGRIPVEYIVRGSLVSRLWSRLRGLALRPSSPKPAFAARECKRVPEAGVKDDQGRRMGGYLLAVRLHSSEHPEHFRPFALLWDEGGLRVRL